MLLAVIIPFNNYKKCYVIEKTNKVDKEAMDLLDIIEHEEKINPILRTKSVKDYDRSDYRYLHNLIVNKYNKSEQEYNKIIQLIFNVKTGRFSSRINNLKI